MIKLSPEPRPNELTDELVEQLTMQFRTDNSLRVWGRKFITDALLRMSHGKCCYCECNITEESKYMEVEHFRCKSIYPDDVLLWPNLLPACKRCNGAKGDHDVETAPIVHPVTDDPREHLVFRSYRFYGKTEKGITTCLPSVLNLNDRDRLQIKRFEIGSKIKEELDDLEEQINDGLNTPRQWRRVAEKLKRLMRQGLPTEEYAATVSTEILREHTYRLIKAAFLTQNLWDDDFQTLEDDLSKIAYL